jgi:hypothetical protein
VACPYFLPQGELPTGLWVHEPRWPLGRAYSGLCCSRADEPFQPPEQSQEKLCNYGYARGICECFPAEGQSDAVRFSVIEDDGSRLRLVYVLEKEHAPAQFGTLRYCIAARALLPPHPDAVLSQQAEAFAKSYLACAAVASDIVL